MDAVVLKGNSTRRRLRVVDALLRRGRFALLMYKKEERLNHLKRVQPHFLTATRAINARSVMEFRSMMRLSRSLC